MRLFRAKDVVFTAVIAVFVFIASFGIVNLIRLNKEREKAVRAEQALKPAEETSDTIKLVQSKKIVTDYGSDVLVSIIDIEGHRFVVTSNFHGTAITEY